ncbi:putative PPPDE putative peptidase domain containing protein [Trypanosoma cruzi]|nr:putative PPPDE putative peptidase domain containing protein [Trypanosoma cruzi]
MGLCDSKSKQVLSTSGVAEKRKNSSKGNGPAVSSSSTAAPGFPPSFSSTVPAGSSSNAPTTTTERRREGVAVVLNIYNLQRRSVRGSRSLNEWVGLGVYHTGVEVFGTEWSFAGCAGCSSHVCGIFPSLPKTVLPRQMLKETIVLGYLPPDTEPSRIYAVLRKMSPLWSASNYHIFQRNCNHFSRAFCDAISKEFPEIKLKKFPSYVNRAARVADMILPDVFYRSWTKGNSFPKPNSPIPAAAEGEDTAGASSYGFGSKDEGVATIPIPSTREAMESMTVRELKTMMWVNGISWDGCIETEDLIQSVEAHRQRHPRR